MANQLIEVGDLVEVISTVTTGINNGDVGLVVKIEQISRHITIYWIMLGIYNMCTPLWEQEIRLLSEKIK
tara:strand:- start:852 stop:1061 length:210 start_codon:yes stop_codon:yes gene_type:complete